jgi:acetyltransferase-like isoleucine patch superfamily enzyme
MIRKAAIRLGKALKGDVFTIDDAMPLGAIAAFGWQRVLAALRGAITRSSLRAGSGFPLFIGRKVVLRTRSRISLGRGVTIGDGALIQGLSRNGVSLAPGVSIGAHSIIMPTSVMRNLGEGCEIGTNSGIGQYSFIGCGGGVRIGANVIMGQYVSFHTENHNHGDIDKPIVAQGVRRAPVVIEDDVWVGVKATFLSGSHVGRGCIVAAGAVVRGSIEPYSIIGGVPARVIGTRRAGDPLLPDLSLGDAPSHR